MGRTKGAVNRGEVNPPPEKRSLYDCLHAKVEGDRIFCFKGHCLNKGTENSKLVIPGSLSITMLIRGQPLEMDVCQNCPDFDRMDGGKVQPEDRGWAHLLPEETKLKSLHGNHLDKKRKKVVAPGD